MTAAGEAATCGLDNAPLPPAAAAAVFVAESAVTGVAAADHVMGLLLMLKRPGWRKEGTTQMLQHGHTNTCVCHIASITTDRLRLHMLNMLMPIVLGGHQSGISAQAILD